MEEKVTNYIYNSQNQLIGIDLFDGTTLLKRVNYFYGALGRRIEKVVVDNQNSANSLTRRYAYDGQDLSIEFDESNNVLANYTYSTLRTDDVLSKDITASGAAKGLALTAGSYHYLKDSVGTITDITNSSGDKIQHYVYSVYGQVLRIENGSGADITNSPALKPYLAFTARELDSESELYYFRARYYNGTIGRFLQADPLNETFSPYSYSRNDPVNRFDPSGLTSEPTGTSVASFNNTGNTSNNGFAATLANLFSSIDIDDLLYSGDFGFDFGALAASVPVPANAVPSFAGVSFARTFASRSIGGSITGGGSNGLLAQAGSSGQGGEQEDLEDEEQTEEERIEKLRQRQAEFVQCQREAATIIGGSVIGGIAVGVVFQSVPVGAAIIVVGGSVGIKKGIIMQNLEKIILNNKPGYKKYIPLLICMVCGAIFISLLIPTLGYISNSKDSGESLWFFIKSYVMNDYGRLILFVVFTFPLYHILKGIVYFRNKFIK